ncbi:MAG TPA: deoxyribonuclease IV [Myxococcales bacterium]|nr:deoxyribonuclease IV [Myxococcales bacterium]
MLLGAHESTSGGLHEAFSRALADGAEAVQIFTKSSRMWRAKEIDSGGAAAFREAARAAGFPASVHASYLINLGCGPGDLREKSIAAFIDELERCDLIGAPHLVVHPGSCPDTAGGLEAVAAALDRAFAAHKGRCLVLLETAAGQGRALGRAFEELREIRDRCKSPERVGICLDTCHVFAAGYDLSTDRGYDQTFEKFDEVLGIPLLKAFHLNDSMKPLGCRVDRHEHVCKGEIGPLAFRRLVNDARFRDVPGFLEIPPAGNRACLQRLKRLRGQPAKRRRRSRVATPAGGG